MVTSEPEVGRASRTVRKQGPEDPVEAATAFVPWSMPAAILLATGILAAQQQIPLFLVIAGLVLLAVALVVTPWRWAVPFLLLLPLGFGRYELWAARPNPVAGLVGQTLEVAGTSDGQFLSLDDPAGARVVLSPKDKVAAGRVLLTGTFLEPATKRNPGGFDYRAYLRRRGIGGQFLVEEVLSFEPAGLNPKEKLRRGVVAGLNERRAALMEAMTLGLRDNLGDLRDIFAASGLAHVLALSGLHVGILIGVLGVVSRPLGLRRYPVLIILVVGYVLLVGASPSVVRAGAMTCAVLFSLWLGPGRIEPWPALALSAVVALLWNPSWLFDISFQLSYLAVIGILIFTEPLTRVLLGEDHHRLKWWHPKKFVLGGIVVSVAAQLLTLPLVASTFGSVPLLSPVLNVLAVPLATLLVPLGFFAGVFGLLSPVLAILVNTLTSLFAGLLISLAQVGSGLPGLVWGEVAWLGYALFYVGVAALALLAWKQLQLWRTLLVVAVSVSCSALAAPSQAEVIFFDVGQGDSVLIRLPGRLEILIDAGGTPFSDFDTGLRTVVPALKALGVDELELVIASHADADHIEGLVSLLDVVPAEHLLIGARKEGDELFDDLMEVAERNGVTVTEVVRGETVSLGPARLDILNPPRRPFEKDNDNSVVFVLNYKDAPKALFLGDASVDVERELAFPDVEILMAGHHGSRTSTSDRLLGAARPETVVFSYGRNTYGHPNPELIARVRATGAEVHETFKEGAVRVPLE